MMLHEFVHNIGELTVLMPNERYCEHVRFNCDYKLQVVSVWTFPSLDTDTYQPLPHRHAALVSAARYSRPHLPTFNAEVSCCVFPWTFCSIFQYVKFKLDSELAFSVIFSTLLPPKEVSTALDHRRAWLLVTLLLSQTGRQWILGWRFAAPSTVAELQRNERVSAQMIL